MAAWSADLHIMCCCNRARRPIRQHEYGQTRRGTRRSRPSSPPPPLRAGRGCPSRTGGSMSPSAHLLIISWKSSSRMPLPVESASRSCATTFRPAQVDHAQELAALLGVEGARVVRVKSANASEGSYGDWGHRA